METFIVRVWVPDGSPAIPSTLRGLVRHIASGDTATFVGARTHSSPSWSLSPRLAPARAIAQPSRRLKATLRPVRTVLLDLARRLRRRPTNEEGVT